MVEGFEGDNFESEEGRRRELRIKRKKYGKRLKEKIIEEGCPESHLILAKELLYRKSVLGREEDIENAKAAVFWLIRASEEGNVEATGMLRQCLKTGEGITELNYLDVLSCLSTPQNEKMAKRAARQMFARLSAGLHYVTPEQLRRRMRILESRPPLKDKKAEPVFEGSSSATKRIVPSTSKENEVINEKTLNFVDGEEPDDIDEKLTKEDLENAGKNYSRGELPFVQELLTFTDPQNKKMEKLNYIQSSFLKPLVTVQRSCLKFLNYFDSQQSQNVFILLPSSTFIKFFIIFLLHPYVNTENFLLFFPLWVYYISFFAMVILTLQMLKSKLEYGKFRIWSMLFIRYDRGYLKTDDAEFEYIKKNLKPYGIYFLFLLLNIISYPFISELLVPQSEFAIIAFALTFITLYSFRDKNFEKLDSLLLFSFAINVIAKYPYETDGVVRQTWRFLDIELPCFASQIVGSGVEFCLNFREFFYLLMPGIFVKIASSNNWEGTYKILIPHCVTLSWWQIAVVCCKGATFYGLLRATLALVVLVFFVPVVAIGTIFTPAAAFIACFANVFFTPKMIITVILALIPIIMGYYKHRLNLGRRFFKAQIIISVISALFFLNPLMRNFTADNTEIQEQFLLTWDQYFFACQKSSWDTRSSAEVQHGCAHFNEIRVNWEGRIDDIRIVKIHNNILQLLDNVPETLRSKLLCYLGEKYNDNCTKQENEYQLRICQTLNQIQLKDKCHVNSWNRYELEISVIMNLDGWSSPESTIHLMADDSFKNFTLKLQPLDRIWFIGILNHPKSLGSEMLTISAEEIGCINCANKNLTSIKRKTNKVTPQYFLEEIYKSFKRILNFICNPVLNFR